MDSAGAILAFSNILVAAVCILMGIPLVRGSVPMNKLYGIRIRKAFESEENWYKINAYGGRQLILWSLPLALIGLATFFVPLKGNGLLTTAIACAPLIVVVPAVMSYVYAKRL